MNKVKLLTSETIERSANEVMFVLRYRRDCMSWEYDSYCNDHLQLYGSRPMSFQRYAERNESYLVDRQIKVNYITEKLLHGILIN